MASSRVQRWLLIAGLVLLLPGGASAAGDVETDRFAGSLLCLAAVLVASKLGSLVNRLGQPVVLGEILAGVVLGNLGLLGLGWGEALRADAAIRFLSQLGAVVLLFQIGLESDLAAMRRVGLRAMAVACVGVVVPFALGAAVAGPLLFPEAPLNAHLFIGAALTATSIGITGRVFRDAGALTSPEAQLVLGAAVIDDILGLLILGVVSSLAIQGEVDAADAGVTIVRATAFLVVAFFAGRRLAGRLGALFAAIDRGAGTKFALALSTCFVFAAAAHAIGLAPIVGAFAAGLMLESIHFRAFEGPEIERDLLRATADADEVTRERIRAIADRRTERHLDDLIEPVAHLLVPVFFVSAGLQVRLDDLAEPAVALAALAITAIAILGKLVSGAVAGGVDRWLVGWGMVPRGEVGLIFAFVGHSLGVVDDRLLSVIVVVVVLTTLVTPPVLGRLLNKHRAAGAVAARVSP